MGNSERRKSSLIGMMSTTLRISLVLAVVTFATPAWSHEPRVVCYYTNWSVYRPGTARFNPQNINPYLCTHLVYAFGGFTKDNALKPFDKYQDIEKGGYAKFTGLKTYNKNLKLMLAIGGWNEGSARFSPMVAGRERRKEFTRNAIKFLRQNRFDGLDLDWEYPAFRDGGKPKDRENYAKLVKELREEFERESEKTGRPRLLLTMAVPAGIEYIEKGFDVKTLNRYLDWMNLLTYDYHSAFEPAVNHHAPLFPLEAPSEYSVDGELNIDYTIKFYLEHGADRDKLVLGIPTYGRSYTLFNPEATEIGAPADGPGEQGDATREKGYLAYYEICEALKPKEKKRSVRDDSDEDSDEEEDEEEEEDLPWTVMTPNPAAMGPVAFRGNQWVGYDDIDIVKKKAEYVAEMGLGGIMFWSIDNDDFRGTCHGKPYPLIESAKEAYINKLGSTDNVVSSDRAKSVTAAAASRGSERRRNRLTSTTTTAKPAKSQQSNKRKSGSSVTSTTPSWKIVTPEPPTTPDPGTDFKCKDEGFFPHPRDCKKYFWCLDSGPSNLGIVAHHFTCPSGLFFNKAADSCDFARNVLCKKPAATEAPATSKPTTTTTEATTRRAIKLSTKNSVLFRSTTTTTTTPEPEVDEEYEEDDVQADIDAEDPKVIKELIDLIKKVGGVEQLEKQLHLSDSSSGAGGVTTTSTPLNKKLVEKILQRKGNKFPSNSIGGGSQNSRGGPQNAGLEASPNDNKYLKKDRPQYTSINRARGSTPAPSPSKDEDSVEEPAVPEVNNRARAVEPSSGSTGKSLQYVNIRRTTARSVVDAADDTASRNALFERNEPYVAVESPNSLDIASARREKTPEYVTIRRQRPASEEATTAQYLNTEAEESSLETILEKEISSPPSYTSIVRNRPTTTSTTTTQTPEPESPEPTTVLAVQISSLRNSPEETPNDIIDEQPTTVPDVTEPPSTTTTPPVTSSRRTPARRRGTTTTTTQGPAVSTSTQATKDRRVNFRRRTKATAPPDSTEPSVPLATETLQDPPTTPPTRYTYTRRGNSKFNKQTQAGRKEIKKDTKEVGNDAKDGAKVEIRTRQPSLSAGPKRNERPTRTFVRRRLGGAANGTTSTSSSPSSTTASTPSSTTASTPTPSASSSSRRPFRVASRRRLPAAASPVTSIAGTSTRVTTPVTTTREAETTVVQTTTTATADATARFSEESLQEIEEADSIEDPAFRPRIATIPKKTVKIQRRPLTSLRTNKDIDQNPEATNEEKKSKDLSKEDDRKRQSKKYSASFKQNQLDEVIRLKTKSQEEFDATTAGSTNDDYSAETAVAIAAHQLISAPLPSLQDFEDLVNTNTKKSNTIYTTQEYHQYTSPAFTSDFRDEDRSPRPESLKLPVYSSTPRPNYSSTPIYRSTYPGVPNQGFTSKSIPLSGYSKTSGYSSTPGYSSTSFAGSSPRHSEFATAGFLGGGYSVSPLGPSTARYLGSSSKYVAVTADDYGYTGGLSQEPSFFTREYLLESPVTKTYDDEYQYLSPTTPQTTTRKAAKKTVYRRISTTLRPTSPPALVSTTAKPRRVPQKKPFEKIAKSEPGRTYRPIENYDYYDDSQERLVHKYADGTKVVVHGKDSIECLDVGNFPHPSSCKKFIQCAPRSGAILGWEYVCPRGLSFDPVGGMCNWSAGLGCEDD